MKSTKKQVAPKNYLMGSESPSTKSQDIYNFDKVQKQTYGQVWGTQTHLRRRKLIIQKHPEISQYLRQTKPYTLIISFFTVIIALALCYFIKDLSWPAFIFLGYWVGGTVTHTLHILVHDLTHYSGHPNMMINKAFAIFCNIPMGVPSAISFGKHHNDHHNFMGDAEKDPDLPVRHESEASKNFLFKLFFWIFLTIFYAVRPMLFSSNTKLTKDEVINVVIIVCTNILIYKAWGVNAMIYLLFVALISIGPHPAAGHTMAEHFEVVPGMETYDYFGFWNFFNLNLGYHIEHHDFPTCPWYNLPKIRETAPQFYEHLPYHTSYVKLIAKFLFDFKFNLYNRTHRTEKAE